MAIMGFSSLAVLFICTFFDDRFSFISVACGIIILLLTIFIRKFRERVTPFFIAAALIISAVSFEVLSDYKISDAESLTNKEAVIEATVLDEPEFTRSKYYYIVRTNTVDGNNLNIKLRLSSSQYIHAEPYDKIKLKVKLYEIGSFSRDIKLYYQSKGIFLGGYIGNYNDCAIDVAKPEKKPLDYHLLMLRKTVEQRIIEKNRNDYGGVTVGMLTGNKDYISDELIGNIRSAGVAPVFAVSGMHLSVWVMGLYSLLEMFGIRKRLNSIVGIVFTLFFMGVTGFSPSVCRAGIMLLLILVGNLFRKKADSINSLGFAALVLGIINPLIVADIGFLLSFSSTLGIVTLNPWFRKRIAPILSGGFIRNSLKLIAESVFVSVSATVASLGFIIVFIGYISVYSVLSNLLITYAASLCMLCGGFSALMYPFGRASNVFSFLTGILAKYIVKIVDLIADWPLSTINTANEYWIYGVIVAYAVIACAYIIFKNKTAFKAVCLGLAVTVSVCCLLYHFNYAGYTYFKVLNVDDGVAVLISDNKHNALICSPSKSKYISSTVSNAIENEELDIMIADIDGVSSSGVLSIIKETEPKQLIVPEIDRSLYLLMPEDKIIKGSNALVKLFGNINVKFISNSHFSIAYCSLQDVDLCILLRADDIENVPEEYLKGDIFIAAKQLNSIDFNNEIISGEASSNLTISTEQFGNIQIKIKNNNYKIIVEEG